MVPAWWTPAGRRRAKVRLKTAPRAGKAAPAQAGGYFGQTGILNLANRLYGGAVTNALDACRLMAGDTVSVWQVEGSVPLRFTFENAARLYEEL